MNLELNNFEKNHYASNLRQHDDELKWDSEGATHHLIIRIPFGEDVLFNDEYKSALENQEKSIIFFERESVLINNNHFFIILQKQIINSYRFNIKPATYAVFCCEYNNDSNILKIYIPNDACSFQCTVSATISIKVEQEQVQRTIFGRPKNNDGDNNIVSFPAIPNYVNGFLYYRYEGCPYVFPITSEMLNKKIIVPKYRGSMPIIESNNPNAYQVEVSKK